MPIYDYKCRRCETVSESIQKSDVMQIWCPACDANPAADSVPLADRQLSVPAGFRFPDMTMVNRKRQRIKEPVWRDKATGKATSVHP